jgi:hypothetical protein
VDSDVSRGADLVLRSETRIVISGEVIGAPGRHGSLHPKALALIGHDPHTYAGTAADATELLVRFLGGRGDEGLDVSFLAGGRGGNVTIFAPEVRIYTARAGAAGHGGPTGDGGKGGDIRTARTSVQQRPGSLGCYGGAAGHAGVAVRGFRGGRGGLGGGGGAALGTLDVTRAD